MAGFIIVALGALVAFLTVVGSVLASLGAGALAITGILLAYVVAVIVLFLMLDYEYVPFLPVLSLPTGAAWLAVGNPDMSQVRTAAILVCVYAVIGFMGLQPWRIARTTFVIGASLWTAHALKTEQIVFSSAPPVQTTGTIPSNHPGEGKCPTAA